MRLAAAATLTARSTLVTCGGLAVGDEQQRPDVLGGTRCPWVRLAGGTGHHEGGRAGGPQHDALRAQLLLNGLAEVPDGGPAAGDGRDPDGRGQLEFLAQGQFPLGVAGGVPAQQGADAGSVVRGDDHQAAVARGADQGGGVEPAPDGVLPRPQVFAAQQRIAVEQQCRRITAGRDRFRADRGHHQGLRVRNRGQHPVPGRGDHRLAREGAAQFLGRAQGPGGAAPEPDPVARAAAPGRRPASNTSGTAARPSSRWPRRWPAARCRRCNAPVHGSFRRQATARSPPAPPGPGPGRVPARPWRRARRRPAAGRSWPADHVRVRSCRRCSAPAERSGGRRRGPPPPATPSPPRRGAAFRCSGCARRAGRRRPPARRAAAGLRGSGRTGERCSMCRSSPSSQQTTRPRLWTGA